MVCLSQIWGDIYPNSFNSAVIEVAANIIDDLGKDPMTLLESQSQPPADALPADSSAVAPEEGVQVDEMRKDPAYREYEAEQEAKKYTTIFDVEGNEIQIPVFANKGAFMTRALKELKMNSAVVWRTLAASDRFRAVNDVNKPIAAIADIDHDDPHQWQCLVEQSGKDELPF